MSEFEDYNMQGYTNAKPYYIRLWNKIKFDVMVVLTMILRLATYADAKDEVVVSMKGWAETSKKDNMVWSYINGEAVYNENDNPSSQPPLAWRLWVLLLMVVIFVYNKWFKKR